MTPEQENARSLIDEIIETNVAINAFSEYEEEPSVRQDPADPESLAKLAAHWERPLPKQYRAVLELYDGITELWLGGELLSAEKLIEESDEFEDYEGMAPDMWQWIVIFGADSDVVVLDFNNVDENGEPEVVECLVDGEQTRWPNFFAFLAGYSAHMKSELAKLVSDRANLKDD